MDFGRWPLDFALWILDFAFWNSEEKIVAVIGSHANSSKWKMFDPSDESESVEPISVPRGKPENIRFLGENIWFENYRSGIPRSTTADLDFQPVKEDNIDELLPKEIRSDLMQVTYQTKNGKIPALLHLPDDRCENKTKKPAIVYLHGGNWRGYPNGDRNLAREIQAMRLLGYVVLVANYFGDEWEGEGFGEPTHANKSEETYQPQMESINAAGNYLKTLECVDPEKIYLFGHSYGAILGSLYSTESTFAAKTPYRAAILRGGEYPRDLSESSSLSEWQSPRLAVKYGEYNQSSKLKYVESCQVPIHEPKEKIESLEEAIAILNEVNKSGSTTYGVVYNYPENFRIGVSPISRAKDAYLPIFIMQGTNDSLEDAQDFVSELKKNKKTVYTWYVENGGHLFQGIDMGNMIQKIDRFIKQNK